jgi:integrase
MAPLAFGRRGVNRVRVIPRPSGEYWLDWMEPTPSGWRRRRQALGTTDRVEAATAAKAKAAELLAAGRPIRAAATTPRAGDVVPLGWLFDMYLTEKTPDKAATTQAHDRRAADLFLALWGRDRDVRSLTVRDWDAYIRARRTGTLRPPRLRPRPVGARIIEQDLKFLRAVLRWAVAARLLDDDPVRLAKLPRVTGQKRPTITTAEVEALLTVADSIHPMFRRALLLAHETGHRIGAIRQLQWADIDFVTQSVTWRAAHDKTRTEHTTPLTDLAVAVLEEAAQLAEVTQEPFVLPDPEHPGQPVSRHHLNNWWRRAVAAAGLKPVQGRGWHSLRRKFAGELDGKPLRTLMDLGGWKSSRMVVEVYQRPDHDKQRAALADRPTLTLPSGRTVTPKAKNAVGP